MFATFAFIAIVIQQGYAERAEAQAARRGEVVERRRRSTRRPTVRDLAEPNTLFLRKPFGLEELCRAVQSLLEPEDA